MKIAIIMTCWILSALIGYISCRWGNRAAGFRWTQNDRMFAFVFSLLYGPLMPVVILVVFLICKLVESKWGNKEARW